MRTFKLLFSVLLLAFIISCNNTKTDKVKRSVPKNDVKQVAYYNKIPKLKWEMMLTGDITPTVQEDIVFIVNNEFKYSINALNVKSGKENWKFETHDAINTPAAVSDNILYFGTLDGILYAVDIKSGKQLWKFNINSKYSMSVPVVYKNIVYFGNNGDYLYALNKKTGKETWRFKTEFRRSSPPTILNDILYFCGGKYLYILDAQTGKQLREFKIKNEITNNPVVYNDIFYYNADSLIYAMDSQTEDIVWQFKTGGYIRSNPIVYEDVLYFGSGDKYLYALDIKTGKQLWKYKSGNTIEHTPTVSNGVVYFGSYPYLYSLVASSGELLWKYKIDKQLLIPVVSNDMLFLGTEVDFDGEETPFYAIELKDIQNSPEQKEYSIKKNDIQEIFIQEGNCVALKSELDDFYNSDSSLCDGLFSTCWYVGESVYEDAYIKIPEEISADEFIINIFSGNGANKESLSNFSRPSKVELTIYAAFYPEGYTSENGDLYLLFDKLPIIDTTLVLADTSGLQSFKLNLNADKIKDYQKNGLNACKNFNGNEFKIVENPNINFSPSLILKLSVKEAFLSINSDMVCISEIFFNKRFITPFPDNYSRVDTVYIKDDNTLIADYTDKKGITIYQDTYSTLHVNWVADSNWALLTYVKNEEAKESARVEENYLLVDLKNRKIVNEQFEKCTGIFLGTSIIEKDKNGKIYLDNFGKYKIELK